MLLQNLKSQIISYVLVNNQETGRDYTSNFI